MRTLPWRAQIVTRVVLDISYAPAAPTVTSTTATLMSWLSMSSAAQRPFLIWQGVLLCIRPVDVRESGCVGPAAAEEPTRQPDHAARMNWVLQTRLVARLLRLSTRSVFLVWRGLRRTSDGMSAQRILAGVPGYHAQAAVRHVAPVRAGGCIRRRFYSFRSP